MKIQFQEIIDREVEVELPYYSRTKSIACHWYCLYKEDEALHVYLGPNTSVGIDTQKGYSALNDANIQCSKEEFEMALNEAKLRIDKITNGENREINNN